MVCAAALGLLLVAGCARRGNGPVPIRIGQTCVHCGMDVRNVRFACEVVRGGKVKVYDSLECMRAAGAPADSHIYVTDYDHGVLIPLAESYIVRGQFPSPMSGGLAAFGARLAAEDVATQTHGHVQVGLKWWSRGVGNR